MMPAFKPVRGMRDFLPDDAARMRRVEGVSRDLANLYGYREIITPIVESYELLGAKSGTEIRERMYAFKDLGGRHLALRPEFTASVARLVATKMRNAPKPMRLFSVGSLYRYDEPQYGRFREFWQANYEVFGSNKPEADAEILLLTHDLLRRLGLRDCRFKIGHVGILRGILRQEGLNETQQNAVMQLLDKQRWDEALTFAGEAGASRGCIHVLKGVFETKGTDVFSVLTRAKALVEDYDESVHAAENLAEILTLTDESGGTLEVMVESGFARGLEYYTGLIFEVYVPQLAIAIGGGGRYDRLIELFGGEPVPAVGVAQGVDRIVLALMNQKVSPPTAHAKRVVVVPVNPDCLAKAVELASTLRDAGVPVEVEVMRRTVSKALADADRRDVSHAVIVGPEELKADQVVLRDLKKRAQRVVRLSVLGAELLGT